MDKVGPVLNGVATFIAALAVLVLLCKVGRLIADLSRRLGPDNEKNTS